MITDNNPVNMENSQVAFIACAGSAAGKLRFSECETCAEAVKSGFLKEECSSGCVGVGDCVAACTKGAMITEDGRVIVDRQKCDGCGDCAKPGVCPQNLIHMIPADATNFVPCASIEEDEQAVRDTCGFGCIACGECEKVCPVNAIRVINQHAVIDYDKCVGCQACATVCKKKIIVDTYHQVNLMKSKVAFVHCSGSGKVSAALKAMNVHSCKEAAEIDMEANGLCATGCLGFGECTVACQNDAIHVVNGVSVVDPAQCLGCGDCTYVCPRHLISLIPYKGQKVIACSAGKPYEKHTEFCSEGCNFCGRCADNCPNSAIHIKTGRMEVDPMACDNCKMCQHVCEQNVIKELIIPEHVVLQQEAFLAKEAY